MMNIADECPTSQAPSADDAEFFGEVIEAHAKDFEIKQRLLAERAAVIAALRESEERFRKSFEDASIGMALVALDGRWMKVNRAMCDIVGYTSDELLATDFQSITHPDDLNAGLDLLEQLTAGKIRTYQIFKRYIHRTGGHVWIQLNVSLVRDAVGKPLYFVSQIQDITERKRMEDALRDSERAYRTMFDLAGAGMANVDLRTGRFLNVNQRLCELLGYSPAELTGMSVHEITHPDDRDMSIGRVQTMTEMGSHQYAYQKRYVRKDGASIWVIVDATSFVDGQGSSTHVVAMIRDITDQKLAEEAVRVKERQFRTLAEHAPVAIFQSDLEGNNVFANARWCHMTGYTAAQASGAGWMRAVHPDDVESLRTKRTAAIQSGREFAAQYRYVRPDGQVVWVHGSAAPLRNEAGEITGYLGTATDLTDRMRAEWLEGDRREVLEMVAQDRPIDAVLSRIVYLLQRQVDGTIAAVFLLDRDTLSIEAPQMPAAMIEAIHHAPLSLTLGLIRAALAADGSIGVTEMETDPVWSEVRASAAMTELKTCWTAPIGSNVTAPLGTLNVFCKQNRRPTHTEMDLMLMVGKLATISIEHHLTTQKLAHLVRHDRLTGLPNRLMLDDRLQLAIGLARRSGKSVGLMILDIDKFKNYNDSLGHHAGDQLLQQFAQRLSSALRKTDTMARVGGDEFVIVLPEINDPARVEIVAQKLIVAMAQPFQLDVGPVSATTSIGIALFPTDAVDDQNLQQRADAALYRVKEHGRNGFEFYASR